MGWFARVPSFNETWLVNRSNCEDIFLQDANKEEWPLVSWGVLLPLEEQERPREYQ